jgi:signal transduction histidine kinase
MSTRERTQSLRRRLALSTTGFFLLVGALLVVVQYAVLSTVIEHSVVSTSGGSAQSPSSEQAVGAVLAVAEELQWTVTVVSTVIVVVLALVAGGLTWRTASRSLGRVADVTALARDLSEKSLSSRIALEGPDDEIKDLADTLDGMLERLETAFRSQERFVASASHELRTPITAIRTALEPAILHDRFPDDVRPSAERALDAAKRAEQLIGSLLHLARAGAPASRAFEDVRLDDIADALSETAAEEASQHGLELTSASEPVTVRGDHTLLTQLTSNLIDNALKHNVAGGWVEVSLESQYSSARLTVKNSSAGLDGPLDRLLEPFNRGNHTRTAGAGPDGHGLGLAIVKAITDEHDGRVSIAVGESNVFVVEVELPVVAETEEEAGSSAMHAPASSR